MERVWLKNYPKSVPHEISIAQYSSINQVFDEACSRFAMNPSYTNMGTTLSYLELQTRANQFASFLQNTLGLKKGDRIALQMPNVLQFPIAMMGALKAGLVIVNTNPLYTEREMKHQFNDAGCVAVLILANFAHHLESILNETSIKHVIITELGDQLQFPKSFIVNGVIKHVKKMVPPFHIPSHYRFNEALAEGTKHALKPVAVSLDDLAFLQYTGGTTGVSKGAMLTHRNIVSNMEQIVCWMKPLLLEGQERVLCPLPLYHIFCLTLNGLTMAKYGGHNLLITNPRDIPSVVKDIKKFKPTVTSGVNTLFNAMLNNEAFCKLDFSQLKASVAGGMALQRPVSERWRKVTGSLIVEGYGLTETSPVASCNPIDGTDRVGTIGLPIPSTEIMIVDDNGKEVALGEIGEICIRGPQVMKGYWKRDDETAKIMLDGGWLKTGDIGYMDKDGFTKIVDRKKDMILVSGFNVYPNEVEEVIAAHPAVLEVAAIGVPDEHSGEVVKIFVVKKPGVGELKSDELIKFAKENLVNYKIPKHVEFRDELPKTNVGKILRRALR